MDLGGDENPRLQRNRTCKKSDKNGKSFREKKNGKSSVETYIRISGTLIRRSEGVGDVGGPADTSRIVATVRCIHLYREEKKEGKNGQGKYKP